VPGSSHFTHSSSLDVQIVSDSLCDLDNDQITGRTEMVRVGPKFSTLSRDLDYWVWMTEKLLYMFSILP